MMDFRFYVDIIKDFLKNSSYKQIGRFLAGRGVACKNRKYCT